LGENAPETLLYGCLVDAYTFMKGEPDVIQMYEQRFQEAIARLKNFGEGMENTDAYRTGLVRVQKT
jgi:predicted nucleotidyltransferase